MKIEKIMEEWKKDAKIDEIDLDASSIDIPVLHAKWLEILTTARQKQRSLHIKRKQLNRTLHQYYRGELNNPEDLERVGRDPLLSKPLNSETPMYVESDEEMVQINTKISYQEEIVAVLEEILKSINGRTWNIKNAVEFRKMSHT